MHLSQLVGYLTALNQQKALAIISEAGENAEKNIEYSKMFTAFLDSDPYTTVEEVLGSFFDPDFYDFKEVCSVVVMARDHIKRWEVPYSVPNKVEPDKAMFNPTCSCDKIGCQTCWPGSIPLSKMDWAIQGNILVCGEYTIQGNSVNRKFDVWCKGVMIGTEPNAPNAKMLANRHFNAGVTS